MIISILFGLLALMSGYLALFLTKVRDKAIFYPLFVIAFIFTWQSALGIPMPDDLNLFHKKGKLIAQQLDEPNKAIYVWVLIEGTTQPISIQIPWVKSTAEQLHNAKKNNLKLAVELPSSKERVIAKLKSMLKGSKQNGTKIEGIPTDKPPNSDQQNNQPVTRTDPTKAAGLQNSSGGLIVFYPDQGYKENPPKTGEETEDH